MTTLAGTNVNFQSRVSVRAVTAGVLAVLALMTVFSTLGAAFGVWNMNMGDIRGAPLQFWLWGFIAWNISVYLGARLAVAAARNASYRDALIQSITTWAGSTVTVAFVLAAGTGRLLDFAGSTGYGPFWVAFIGNSLALGVAFLAAGVESHSEGVAARLEAEKAKRAEAAEKTQLRTAS